MFHKWTEETEKQNCNCKLVNFFLVGNVPHKGNKILHQRYNIDQEFKTIHLIVILMVDSLIHLLNNPGQIAIDQAC